MSGRVHESLINSEKTSTPPAFEENSEIFLRSRFSVIHVHDLMSKILNIEFE
jgi:hypothetical protein